MCVQEELSDWTVQEGRQSPACSDPAPPHRATSCRLEFPLAAKVMTAAVGVAFLKEVRRMWEVLCR